MFFPLLGWLKAAISHSQRRDAITRSLALTLLPGCRLISSYCLFCANDEGLFRLASCYATVKKSNFQLAEAWSWTGKHLSALLLIVFLSLSLLMHLVSLDSCQQWFFFWLYLFEKSSSLHVPGKEVIIFLIKRRLTPTWTFIWKIFRRVMESDQRLRPEPHTTATKYLTFTSGLGRSHCFLPSCIWTTIMFFFCGLFVIDVRGWRKSHFPSSEDPASLP